MTPRQYQILELIRYYLANYGYAPTFTELGVILSVSKVTIREHLKTMERQGVIRLKYRQARSVEIVEDNVCPHCGRSPSC